MHMSHIFFAALGNGILATKGIGEVCWQQATLVPAIVREANVLVTRSKKEKERKTFHTLAALVHKTLQSRNLFNQQCQSSYLSFNVLAIRQLTSVGHHKELLDE